MKIGKRTVKNPFEYQIYKQLVDLAPPYSTVEYEVEKLPYTIDHVYIPDLILTKKDGSKLYIEVKGNGRAWTPAVMQKMLKVREEHPDLDIRIVFYSDGAFGARRKDGTRQRQSDWATRHKWPFSIGSIPKEWINE